MAEIKASDVSKLRKQTGAGMMDCKKALQESGGDFDAAIEYIRKKGQAVASKRAEREATEGAVLAKVTESNKEGYIIALNCETDFVAKNEQFVEFAYKVLDLALADDPDSLEDLKQLKLDGKTVEENITDQIGIIGEKIELSHFDKIKAEDVIAYIHPGNKLASLVGFNQASIDLQVKKDVAMQVAAMSPVSIDKDDIPEHLIEQEKEIGREQARQEGKPEDLVEKIAMGKLNKFYKESTLLNQEFIKESKKTVRQYLQEYDKSLTVSSFKRYSLT